MQEVVLKNNNIDFKVNEETGEAYVTQRKASELLGVSLSSLSSYIERHLRTEELDTSQGLSSEIFNFCVQYYALDARITTVKAKHLLKQITTAGAKAYLYHMAGYIFNTVAKQEPMDELTILERSIHQIREQRERLNAVEKTVEGQAIQLEEVNDDIAMVVKEIEGVKKLVLDSSISLEEIYADENAFFEIGEVAAVLIGSGYFTKEKDFRRYLLDKKLCYKKGDNNYHPMAALVKHKYMKSLLVKKGHKTFMATHFTPRGVSWIVKRLQAEQQTELDLGYVEPQNIFIVADVTPATVVRGF